MTATLRSRLVTSLVLGMVWTQSVAADYKRAYHEGYQLARQGRNWEIVAQKMAEAIKENDREGETVVLGSANTQPYLPFFYLGLARFQLGDCRGARDNWIKSSIQKKVVLHGREREWFNDYAPICDHVVSIEDAFRQAQDRLNAISELAGDADLSRVWSQDKTLAPTHVQLRQDLDEARKSLQQARTARVEQQQGLLIGVKASAAQVIEQVDALLKTARTRRDDLAAQRVAQEKQRLAEERKTQPAPEQQIAANRPPEPTRPPEPLKPSGGASTGGGTPAIVEPKPAVKAPEAVPIAPALPEALRTGAEYYKGGRYREARTLLRAQAALPNEFRAHAALLRAASAFAQYHAEGQKDRRLLDEARQAVLECSRARRDLRPSRRLYAPPFIDFFDRTTGPGQTARARD